MVHTILTIYAVFYYEEFRNQVNELKYVPKSQISYAKKWAITMNTWFTELLTWTGDKIIKYGECVEMRNRRKKVYRAYNTTKRREKGTQNKQMKMIVFAAIAMQAKGSFAQQERTHFDTDSEPIGIDNRCTGCISHKIEDFEGTLVDSTRAIKGFGGSRTSNVKIGTITWKWLDDEGMTHKFVIPKSFYVPSGKVRLLSPQHWAQTQKDKTNGTGSETLHDKVTLFWNGHKNKLTIPLGKDDNVATMQTAPGFRKFEAFCPTAGFGVDDHNNPIVASETLIVTDDEEANDLFDKQLSKEPQKDEWCQPIDTEFEFDLNAKKRAKIIDDEEETKQPTNNLAELLKYHHAFGHVSFQKLKEMAKWEQYQEN
jgi:hypothetical protein